MKSRKKKIAILIFSITAVILMILCGILYFNTDMFKSNKTLFIKYIMKNTSNLENIEELLYNKEYLKKLNENKYTTTTTIKLNHIEDIGTSLENANSSINKLSLLLNGKVDKVNNYNYQNIKVLENNEDLKLSAEYINDNNIYSIKFSDLFNEYIIVENSDLKSLYEKIGYEENKLNKIPDSIDIKNDLLNKIEFTEDEKEILEKRYSEILKKQLANATIIKKSNEVIEINSKKIKTNSYILTLTKEEMNSFYLKLLETIKQDDIILNKLKDISETLEGYYSIINISNETNINDYFIEKIDSKINEINTTNIGQEETKIIVYEKDKNTVRTTIKYTDYEINLDSIDLEGNAYLQLKLENLDTAKIKTITLSKEESKLKLEYSDGEEGKNINLTQDLTIDESNYTSSKIIEYQNDTDKIRLNVDENINFVSELEGLPKLEKDNIIKLNDLDNDNMKKILETVNKSLNEKINTTFNSQNSEDFYKVLNIIGIVSEQQVIESIGVTETEKNRFNSQFEILQGNKLSGDNVIKIIQSAQNNIVNIEVVSNTQLKIQIDRNNKDEEITKKLIDFIENNKNKKYNIKTENDEKGLVKYLVIDMLEK